MSKSDLILVDPPMGWRYGFPKPMPVNTDNIRKWLVDNGYPSELISEDTMFIRYIPIEEVNKNENS